MAASVGPLTLYDLLAAEFLAGFSFPSYIDNYLSLLVVTDLNMTSDAGDGAGYPGGVLYTGTVAFPSAAGSPPPVTQHTDPSGAVFNWNDVNFQFRLRTWRNGSSALQSVVDAPVISAIGLGSFFNNFTDLTGAAAGQAGPLANSDYPGMQFRLELLVTLLTFHMGPDWSPGKMDANYHVVKDTTSASVDVEILLPKITLVYEQPEDFSQAPTFSLASWGSSGFDAPSNLGAGELVTMQPPLALHSSGRVAFSVQNILLDLTPGATPPELLGFFGIGDDFTGVYIQQLQFFYSDPDKDFALNILVSDAVISFQGQVWLQAEVDLTLDPASHQSPSDSNANQLQVTISFMAGGVPVNFNDSVPVDGQAGAFQGGSVSAPPTVAITLQVTGGTPPYTFDDCMTFTPQGGTAVQLWDSANNQGHFTTLPATTQNGTLVIKITDSGSLTYQNTMLMQVATPASNVPNGAPEDSIVNATVALATITYDNQSDLPAGYAINFTPSTDSTVETLVAIGGQGQVTASITPSGGGASTPVMVSSAGMMLIEVDPDQTVDFSITFPAETNIPSTFTLVFNLDGPPSDAAVTSYVSGTPSPADPIFTGNVMPTGTPVSAATLVGVAENGKNALIGWMNAALDPAQLGSIQITATDSYEGYDDRTQLSQTLSQRRLDVATQIIAAAFPSITVPTGSANGCSAAQSANRISDPTDRAAVITGATVQGQQSVTITGNLARAASAQQQQAAQNQAQNPPPQAPPAGANPKPVSLKRLSLNVRIEKNLPVLLELSGEIDFQQQSQQALQQQTGSTNSLGLSSPNGPSPNASTANPQAATTVVDFLLEVTYDQATCFLTETLTLGAGPADTTGLLQMKNGPAGSYDTLKNVFGAVMIFAPIINAATSAIAGSSAGEWATIGGLAPAAAIGGLGWINTSLITLYGGSLVVREDAPAGIGSAKPTYAALTFDYGVSFRIDIDPLNIHSTRDLSVRYDAFGLSLDFTGSPPFQFVFDTSKGYTLDLSDPGLFNLPSPLGDLLKIAEARIAQFNPLTIECDLEMKVDLGVITVDAFQVKAPLDGSMPMILPSGIHVNLPDIITGGGSVNIQQSGFEGGFDLTLVPLSLRIAATVGIEQIPGPPANPRSATAIFLGMEVDFPTPIILGTSGLGIFGFFGLFAMHYGRNLPAAVPGDAIGPNLQWLIDAGGQPQFLFYPTTGGPSAFQSWTPQIGSWAFGVGAELGTIDGFLLTMRGMFILELPGPEIIITVNAQMLADLPGEGSDGVDTSSLMAGILGILDLNFELGQITLGVSINLQIPESGSDVLIAIAVPISIFFSWDDPDTWHVWLGTIQTPISANILGIVKGSGYFMIGGQAIPNFPPGTNYSLPGVAVAVGFSATIIWGSEDIDIYLEVVVGADLGVSFSPNLLIAGDIHLSGKLELLIISIGASGDFAIVAPSPFYLHVKVCGSVSFFFFSISACVEFGTSGSITAPPPPLIAQMYLQSYAPVIPSGQGGSRPIDASLGAAAMTVASNSILSTLPPAASASNLVVVPIDTVPVLQFSFAADASGMGANTFTETVPQCVMMPTGAGGAAVSLGGGRTATYTITSLTISPPLPQGTPKPPVVWRKNTSKKDNTASRSDLALFSRDPNLASHALERSTTLNQQLAAIWGGTCTPEAPPACVLFTFCAQNAGPSNADWSLVGIATPDPPNTTRSSPPPTAMEASSPVLANQMQLYSALGPLLGSFGFQPAQVIGSGTVRERCMRALELPELVAPPPLTAAELRAELAAAFGTEALSAIGQIDARLLNLAENWRWVRFETGQATSIGLYMAVHPLFERTFLTTLDAGASNAELIAARELFPLPRGGSPAPATQGGPGYDVVVRERNQAGALLRQRSLNSLNPTIVTGLSGLPAEWTDPLGPWYGEIYPLSLYMSSRLAALTTVYVSFEPLAGTTIIEIAEIGPVLPGPSVVIGAVEVCSLAEAERAATGQQVQSSEISTLEGYLSGGQPVPLLAPNTTYTITVEYNVQTTGSSGAAGASYNGVQQGFTFQTDSAPPPQLNPWVMSSTPANNELNVFFDDPVTIVFNDQEAIQLFGAYSVSLVLELHAADGLNDPSVSASASVSTSALTPVSGFGPAGYDSLLNMVDSGALPCVGAVSAYQNQQFTADVDLRPCMAYTLDIVTSPAATPSAGEPLVPLYRTRFTTSQYASLGALAAEIGGSPVLHRHLSGSLGLGPPASGNSGQVTDQTIETAFLNAGEKALPAAAQNAITIYWKQANGTGPYLPYCLLIDTTEPLWRTRQEPALVPVDSTDPSFVIVEITPVTALEVRETGGSAIAYYLYSTNAARTLAFLSGTGKQKITLELHRPASQVFGLPDSAATIITLPINAQAPWEADHV
jgi:hypothetical protein